MTKLAVARRRRWTRCATLLLAGTAVVAGAAVAGSAGVPAGASAAAATTTTTTPTPPPAYVSSLVPQGGLRGPATVCEDAAGDLWVVDTGAGSVKEVDPSTRRVLVTIGRVGSQAGELRDPEGVALDSLGDVFVADTGNNRVEEFTTTGKFERTIGRTGTGNGEFREPDGIAFAAGVLYVSDEQNNRIETFDATTGAYRSALTTSVYGPAGLTVDARGNLWEAQQGEYDLLQGGALEFSPKGTLLHSFLGTGTIRGGFSDPTDIAVDRHGHVFIAQPDTDYVIEMTTSGVYLDEFGTSGKGTLASPFGVTLLSSGLILVVDSGHNRLAFFK